MESVLLDSSFLISLSNSSRSDHETAKTYFKAFIEKGVVMYLSTIVVCEFEVRQRVSDLGLHNFIVLPFNYDQAIIAAVAFSEMHKNRVAGSDRLAVSADAKILGQCVAEGISHFITGDQRCCERILSIRDSTRLTFPIPVSLQDGYDQSWFNGGQFSLDNCE